MATKHNHLPSIKDETKAERLERLQQIEYDKQIKAKPLQQEDYGVRVAGCEGLYLRVRPNGTREFRHFYPHPFIKNKQIRLTLGEYPAVSLKRARELYYDNSSLLADGIDPKEHREQQKRALETGYNNTFQKVAEQWLERRLSVGKKPSLSTIKTYNRMLKYINAKLANVPIDQLKMTTLLTFCQDLQDERGIEVGQDAKTVLNYVFDHAVNRGLVEMNPVRAFPSRSLEPSTNKPKPAITTPSEFGQLLRDIDQMTPRQPDTIIALKLLALTYARVGDICSMKWADIDFQGKLWNFEPLKGKGRKDMVDELAIPLAPQTIAILKEQHKKTGGHEFVFHSPKNKKGILPTGRINYALNNYGNGGKTYLNIHTPHGFRASAKTMQMERLGYDELITEMQLGHKMINKYGKAYSRFKFIEVRTKMMNEWADYIDNMRAGKIDNIIYANFKHAEQKQG